MKKFIYILKFLQYHKLKREFFGGFNDLQYF